MVLGSHHASYLKGTRVLFPCELLSALSLLQLSVQAGYQAVVETGMGLTMGLRVQVLEAATALGVTDPSGVCLEPADEDMLDLVGRLFEAILRDNYFYFEPRVWICQLRRLHRLTVACSSVMTIQCGACSHF
ncbi:MAG TPA: hypothetical protein ACQGQH_07300 [Xylella sp.]